jgi:hypothetical protein
LATNELRIRKNDAISTNFPPSYSCDFQQNHKSGDWEADFIIAGRVASCYSLSRIEGEKSEDQFFCFWIFSKEFMIEKTYTSENLPSPLFAKEG